MRIPYCGVGSRETPTDIIKLMTNISHKLSFNNFKLRSGAAPGADYAFDLGTKIWTNHYYEITHSLGEVREIYIPWEGFNGLRKNEKNGIFLENNEKALEFAKKYHPAFDKLSKGAKLLMQRNSHQVMGRNMDNPVIFLICYTSDGSLGSKTTEKTGGTGQALRIANDLNIPIINLQRKLHLELMSEWVKNEIDPDDFTSKFNFLEEII